MAPGQLSRAQQVQQQLMQAAAARPGSPAPATPLRRCDVLAANLLVARVLVPHVLLRPWEAAGDRRPRKRVAVSCSVLATLVFRVLRRVVRGRGPGPALVGATSQV